MQEIYGQGNLYERKIKCECNFSRVKRSYQLVIRLKLTNTIKNCSIIYLLTLTS